MTQGNDSPLVLRNTLADARGPLLAVVLFSAVVNLLMLTGPVYMLQVYDRVLTGRSLETLVALSLIAAMLFLAMGMLDQVRGRIMVRLAARLRQRVEPLVLAAALRRLALAPDDPVAARAARDLDAVQHLLAAPVLPALCDLPWTPLFLALLFAFHPWLGWLAVSGAACLVGIALLSRRSARDAGACAEAATAAADARTESLLAGADSVQALGMGAAALATLSGPRDTALTQATRAAETATVLSALSRCVRLLLQSAMLGLGAWLVLRGAFSAGAMIAASVLLGRALAPVEQVVAQWQAVARGRAAWRRIGTLVASHAADPPRIALPRPRARLEVEGLMIAAPGTARTVLRGIGFSLSPGMALGVIGPSGAGKSTLARALTGLWPAGVGSVRLDGAALDQYGPDVRGGSIGYLPQRISMFAGTVAQNIARLAPDPDPAAVIAAAHAAAAHEMILRLPQGYDTPLNHHGSGLSGGQMQRIGLARALYGDPVILVLDEPNASLDGDGTLALSAAIRAVKARGGAVIVMSHRPNAIQDCEMLLVLRDGTQAALGPREAVLRAMLRNHAEILPFPGSGTAA